MYLRDLSPHSIHNWLPGWSVTSVMYYDRQTDQPTDRRTDRGRHKVVITLLKSSHYNQSYFFKRKEESSFCGRCTRLLEGYKNSNSHQNMNRNKHRHQQQIQMQQPQYHKETTIATIRAILTAAAEAEYDNSSNKNSKKSIIAST